MTPPTVSPYDVLLGARTSFSKLTRPVTSPEVVTSRL